MANTILVRLGPFVARVSYEQLFISFSFGSSLLCDCSESDVIEASEYFNLLKHVAFQFSLHSNYFIEFVYPEIRVF